ncbi:MAG: ACT domain-containing protein [Acidobacteriota bacterium]
MSEGLPLRWLEGRYAVCRLDAGEPVSAEGFGGPLICVAQTAEETSILCSFDEAPQGARVEGPFAAFGVLGPLDFSLTGILAALAQTLAEARVSIFAVSTFDTDYVLVPADRKLDAIAALEAAGHTFSSASPAGS